MAHDRNGVALAIGDKVQVPETGKTFHINGAVLDDGTVVGKHSIGKAKVAARAQDVEMVKEASQNREILGEGCIVWGNGPPAPEPVPPPR